MALNPILPYLIRVEYLVDGLFHKLDVGVDTVGEPPVGGDPDDIQIVAKSLAAEISLTEAANDVWGDLRPFLHTSVLANTFTFWKTNPFNGVLELLSAGPLASPNGVSSTAYVPAQQATWTFRCGGGTIKKVVLQEVSIPGNSRAPQNPADPFTIYSISSDSVLMSRGRGFPIQPLNLSVGQNEQIWRARYR